MKQVQLPKLAAGRVYLVVGPGVWGRNEDFAAAMNIARSEYGGAVPRYIIFDAPADTQVDAYGSLVWTPIASAIADNATRDAATTAQAPREIMRVGFAPKE